MKTIKLILSTILVACSSIANAQFVNIKTSTDTYSISHDQIQEMVIGPTCLPNGKINGHDYVIIGGKKWATMNIGATTVAGSYRTAYGNYFAWGETTPYYSSINLTSDNTATITWGYKITSYSHDNNKYYANNSYLKYKETKSILDGGDDAATANWGGTWRTPTEEDFCSLIEACSGNNYSTYVSELSPSNKDHRGVYKLSKDQTILSEYTGVAGYLFVQDADHKLFLPSTGYIEEATFTNNGNAGYWSSTVSENGSRYASFLQVNNTNAYIPDNGRNIGKTIRAVSD